MNKRRPDLRPSEGRAEQGASNDSPILLNGGAIAGQRKTRIDSLVLSRQRRDSTAPKCGLSGRKVKSQLFSVRPWDKKGLYVKSKK